MKAELLSPFADAAYYVLKQTIGDEALARGTLSLRESPHISNGIATLVGLTGDLRGHLVLDMDRRTAVAVASRMVGETLPGLDSLARSAISELTNMIGGQATMRLADQGVRCDLTPPTCIIGNDTTVFAHDDVKNLVLPLGTSCGEIRVSLAIVENDAPPKAGRI